MREGRVLIHLRRNVVAYVALFFALGGVAGAAAQPLLDRSGSVSGRHIEPRAVHGSDLADGAVGAGKLSPRLRSQLGPATPTSGAYQGRSDDGSIEVTAVVVGGQIVDMTVVGDCAWAEEGGEFDGNGNSWTYASATADDVAFEAFGEFVDAGTMQLDSMQVIGGAAPEGCPADIQLDLAS